MEISDLNLPDFFIDIRSIKKAKKYWEKLTIENHPNSGGNIEVMQKINYQYFNLQNKNNPDYFGKKWEVDITNYIKLLDKRFSDINWLTYIQHPKIVDLITIINRNKTKIIK